MKSFVQILKFTLFSVSAGIIQVVAFTLLNELLEIRYLLAHFISLIPSFFSTSVGIIQVSLFRFIENLSEMPYWPAYLISLTLSVLWNFTFNRKFTFKSAANVPLAMAKVFGFYLVFTPLSTILGSYAEKSGVNEYIVLGVTMISNFVLEFLFCKFVVYRNNENTLESNKKQSAEA